MFIEWKDSMIVIPEFNIDKNKWIEGKVLNGKKLAQEIRSIIKVNISKNNLKPGLAVLLVGEDPASSIYVGSKEKACIEVGYHSIVEKQPADISQNEIISIIQKWNNDKNIHGILVQLPLPKHINEREVLLSIDPQKDVDGFHLINVGKLFTRQSGIVSCTPLGIMVMLKEAGIDVAGKNAVVLGRSNIVGKPMGQLLMDYGNATVTICHSKTKEISKYVQQADIIVSAMGVRNIISSSDVKEGSIVIDVGMHRTSEGLTGDLNLKELEKKVQYYTPVPGGVGPMTIAMLIYNTYNNAK